MFGQLRSLHHGGHWGHGGKVLFSRFDLALGGLGWKELDRNGQSGLGVDVPQLHSDPSSGWSACRRETTNASSLNHKPPCFCSTSCVASRYEPVVTTSSSRSSSTWLT